MTGRVLVTGATGFVGSHAAEALAADGWSLRCTLRASSDTRWLEGLEAERVEVDMGAAGEEDRLRVAVAGVDVVVHAAGLTRAPSEEAFRRVNAEGTRRLAAAAREAGVGRFVLVSSLAARGPDGADGPVSAYGRSKRAAEDALRAEAGSGPMEAVALRPGGVYGPRDTNLLPLFRTARRGWLAAPARGAPLQPVYVEDVAAAAAASVRGAPGFGPHPVAERGRYAWDEVARALGAAFDRRVRLLPLPPALFVAAGAAAEAGARLLGRAPAMDRRRARDLARLSWTCDSSAAERALGWRARVALPEGVARTARWYVEAGWLAR